MDPIIDKIVLTLMIFLFICLMSAFVYDIVEDILAHYQHDKQTEQYKCSN
jgi:hypothetical protein